MLTCLGLDIFAQFFLYRDGREFFFIKACPSCAFICSHASLTAHTRVHTMSTRLHSIPHTPTPPLSPPVPPHYQLQPPTPHCHSTLRSGCPLQTKCFCVQTSLTSFFLISSALDLVQGLSPPAEVAHSHAWWGWGPRPLPGVRVRSNPRPVGGVPGAHQLAPPPALPWRVPRQPPRLLPVCRVARAKGFLRTVCTVAAWITGVSISFRPLFHRPLPSVGIFRCICVLHLIAYCTMNHFSVCRRVGWGGVRSVSKSATTRLWTRSIVAAVVPGAGCSRPSACSSWGYSLERTGDRRCLISPPNITPEYKQPLTGRCEGILPQNGRSQRLVAMVRIQSQRAACWMKMKLHHLETHGRRSQAAPPFSDFQI